MVNGWGKQAWRCTRKEISLNNRDFWLAQVEVQSSCTWFWQQWNFRALRTVSSWESKARRNPVMHRGYRIWLQHLTSTICWPRLWLPKQLPCPMGLTPFGQCKVPRQSLQKGNPEPAPVLLPCPHTAPPPHSISPDWTHQIAKTLLPFESYCLPIT